MAITVDKSAMTDLWDADSTQTWNHDTGTREDSTFTDRQREGNACLGFQVSNEHIRQYLTFTSFDISDSRNKIYMWMYSTGYLDTTANGGFQIGVGDGTNRRYYYVGGSDFFGFQVGAWSCFVLDPQNLPTNYYQAAGSAAPDFSAVTQVGWGNKTLAKSLGGNENFFLDIARWGPGIRVEGGGASTQGTLAELAADDASKSADKAYGMIRELATGVYGIQGDIIFGDNGTADSYFEDADAIVVAEDSGPAAVEISLSGNSTGTNSFVLGAKVGSGDTAQGRNGVTIMSAGPTLTIDLDDSNMDTVQVYGSKFFATSTITLPTDTTAEIIGTTFDQCGQVTANQAIIRACTFSGYSPDGDAALLWNSTINIKNSQFIANTDGTNDPHAIEHSASGTFTYIGLTFSGNDYDINFSAASGTLTITATAGSDPASYEITGSGTSVTINNSKTLTLSGLIANTEVRIYRTGTTTEEDGVENSGTSFGYSYNYPTGWNVDIVIHKADYEHIRINNFALGSSDATIPIQQRFDRNYENP
jgi:hypothetical protein